MDTYTWETEEALATNELTMSDYINNHMAENWQIDFIDGTYIEVILPTGEKYGLHASGNGDFNSHKIDFELLNGEEGKKGEDTLKVEVPYIYEAVIVKPRCRKPSLAVVKDSVNVEIKRVEPKDAPKAIKVGDKNIYLYGKTLWTEVYLTNGKLVTDEMIIEHADNQDGGYQHPHSPFKSFWGSYHSEFIGSQYGLKREFSDCDYNNEKHLEKSNIQYRQWKTDSREAVIQKAHAIARTMISVNGVIYQETAEPYYNNTSFGAGNNMTSGFFICWAGKEEIVQVLSERFNFNALSYKKALKYAREYAASIGDTRYEVNSPNCGNVIEVLIPEAITVLPQINKDKYLTTIEKVLGHKPTKAEVDIEFEKRQLSLSDFDETVVEVDGQYHVHGNYQTKSESAETASKKMLIIYDELGC